MFVQYPIRCSVKYTFVCFIEQASNLLHPIEKFPKAGAQIAEFYFEQVSLSLTYKCPNGNNLCHATNKHRPHRTTAFSQ